MPSEEAVSFKEKTFKGQHEGFSLTLSASNRLLRGSSRRRPPVVASVVSLVWLVCLQQLVRFTKQMKISY